MMRWLAFGAIGLIVGGGCTSSGGSEQAESGGTKASSGGRVAPPAGGASPAGGSGGAHSSSGGTSGGATAGASSGGAGKGGAASASGGRAAPIGGAFGVTGGTASVGGSKATGGTPSGSAGAPPAECDLSSLTTTNNEAGIGAGCVDSSQARELGACSSNFCISRPLSDRWTEAVGFCSKHCESSADCGTGFECCEPRPGPVCFPYEEHALLGSGCAERCASNHLNCPSEEICCERVGKLCISELCSNICP